MAASSHDEEVLVGRLGDRPCARRFPTGEFNAVGGIFANKVLSHIGYE